MIALTQEKREELIADCRKSIALTNTYISFHGETPELKSNLQRQEVALASLTAEPVAYMTYKGYLLHAADPKLSEYSDPEPLYDAPPVPEINFPGISALVDHQGCLPAVRDIAIWDFAISEVKRLNGWGE